MIRTDSRFWPAAGTTTVLAFHVAPLIVTQLEAETVGAVAVADPNVMEVTTAYPALLWLLGPDGVSDPRP